MEEDPAVAWHCKSVFVMALLAAAEDGSRAEGKVDEAWLEVSGGAEALGRSLQKALIDRTCNRLPPTLQLHVRPSAIPEGGKGLYAMRDFAPGELVLELFGALVPRGPRHERSDAKDYLFGLNERFQVDPMHPAVESEWRVAWAINHSCSPNLVALKSNYQLLGFSSKEAAHMRQPLAPPEEKEQTRQAAEEREKETLAAQSEKEGWHKGQVDLGRECKRQRTADTLQQEQKPRDDDEDVPGGEGGAQRRGEEEEEEAQKNDLIFFVAIKRIARGDELFFDYNRAAAGD